MLYAAQKMEMISGLHTMACMKNDLSSVQHNYNLTDQLQDPALPQEMKLISGDW